MGRRTCTTTPLKVRSYRGPSGDHFTKPRTGYSVWATQDTVSQSWTSHIPLDEDEWVWHYNVRLNVNNRMLKQVRRQLEHEQVTHHRLDHTF